MAGPAIFFSSAYWGSLLGRKQPSGQHQA
jgi:hypothetical protein